MMPAVLARGPEVRKFNEMMEFLRKSKLAIWRSAHDSCGPVTLSGDPQIAVGS